MLEGREVHEHDAFITEAGFYKLVFASEAPAAKKFRAWVLDELLLRWFEETGNPEFVYRMNQIMSGGSEAELSVAIVATEILPVSRMMPWPAEEQYVEQQATETTVHNETSPYSSLSRTDRKS